MSKTKKEILILIGLALMCLGLWLYIWQNLMNVVAEFNSNYTGTVKYAWRWEKLPIKIIIDKSIKINEEELSVVAAHFNYFFQSRYHADMIEFTRESSASNSAYLMAEDNLAKDLFAYTLSEGEHNRPSIYIRSDYNSWDKRQRMSILMHEIGHLVGLPHFELEGSLMREIQKSPNSTLSEIEQELIYILYAHKLGSKIILPN